MAAREHDGRDRSFRPQSLRHTVESGGFGRFRQRNTYSAPALVFFRVRVRASALSSRPQGERRREVTEAEGAIYGQACPIWMLTLGNRPPGPETSFGGTTNTQVFKSFHPSVRRVGLTGNANDKFSPVTASETKALVNELPFTRAPTGRRSLGPLTPMHFEAMRATPESADVDPTVRIDTILVRGNRFDVFDIAKISQGRKMGQKVHGKNAERSSILHMLRKRFFTFIVDLVSRESVFGSRIGLVVTTSPKQQLLRSRLVGQGLVGFDVRDPSTKIKAARGPGLLDMASIHSLVS
eukprot:7411076-Pyramimonas_sp.AAC.2